jgi:four helix bundle protein
LTDCDAENTETEVWIMFAFSCKYISEIQFKTISEKVAEVGRMLGSIISNPEKYL